MDTVTPRWEWRTFGASFDAAEIRLPGPLGDPRHSAETYFVSRRSDANTKLRDHLIDVKLLQQVDAHGLELWRPVLKAGFPLSSPTLDRLFAFWSLPRPRAFDTCDVEADLPRAIGTLVPDVRVVPVKKSRRRLSADGCQIEVSDLTFDDVPLRTIAVEGTERDRVLAMVGRLGFDGRSNTNYVRALKRFLLDHPR